MNIKTATFKTSRFKITIKKDLNGWSLYSTQGPGYDSDFKQFKTYEEAFAYANEHYRLVGNGETE